MKKITLLLLLLIVAAGLNSCRKGEEDPAISLRSRDGRLTGTWSLVNIRGSATETTNNIWSYDFSYNNQLLTIVGPGDTHTFPFTINMSIDKRGKMAATIVERSNPFTTITDREDSWFWLNSTRNKTHVFLGGLRGFLDYGLVYDNLVGFTGVGEFEVLRLSNRELKLRYLSSTRITEFDQTYVWSEDIVLTFQKQ